MIVHFAQEKSLLYTSYLQYINVGLLCYRLEICPYRFKIERGGIRQKCQTIQESIQCAQTIIDGMKHFWDVVAARSSVEKITRGVLHELVDYVSAYPAIRTEMSSRKELKSTIYISVKSAQISSSVTCK